MAKPSTQALKTFYLSLFSSVIGMSGLMLAIVATVVFLLLSKQVLGEKTIDFDTNILQYFLSIYNPNLTVFFVLVTLLGKPIFLIIVNLLFSLFLWTRNKISIAIIYFVIGNGAAGFNLFLKSFLGRERPLLWDRIVEVKHLSYPSAHAMNSVVVYGLVCYYLMNQFKPWRGLIFACTFLLVILIGLSRLYLGVHWPTDIIAGYILGFVWLSVAISILEFIKSLTNSQVNNISTE